MNSAEIRMVSILKELKEKYGAVGVRADFEAEGTRLEDLLRLKEVCMFAEIGLNLKIGGCESVRDLLEAKIVGVDSLTAPMIESPYALRKYLQAVSKVFSADELESMEILCNIESHTALEHLDEMLQVPEIKLLNAMVIARVDLCFSLGMEEKRINDSVINDKVKAALGKIKRKGLKTIIGGGVSAQSLPLFQEVPAGHLDYYQTRKVCFSAADALKNDPEKGLLKALTFEYLWLKNKHNYYKETSILDKHRISLIEEQYLTVVEALV